MKRFIKGTKPDLQYIKAIKKPLPIEFSEISEPFEVETMEGVMQGKAGDYLVYGVDGEMYVIDRAIFFKTYSIVSEAEAEEKNTDRFLIYSAHVPI